MADISANFSLNNEPLNSQFSVAEISNFDSVFQIEGGAIWGSIGGDIQNQTDLIELLNSKINSINGSALIGIDRTNNIIKIFSKSFDFEQGIASDTWIIEHNLNKNPSYVATDSAGNVQIPNEVIYNSPNVMTMQFLSPFAGKAFLN